MLPSTHLSLSEAIRNKSSASLRRMLPSTHHFLTRQDLGYGMLLSSTSTMLYEWPDDDQEDDDVLSQSLSAFNPSQSDAITHHIQQPLGNVIFYSSAIPCTWFLDHPTTIPTNLMEQSTYLPSSKWMMEVWRLLIFHAHV